MARDKAAIVQQAQSDAYDSQGVIKLQLTTDVRELNQQFLSEMCSFLKRWGGASCTPESLATDLVGISQRDRGLVGKLYKVSRRFPAAKRLACHPYFVHLAEVMMKTDLVSCCNFVAIRIDLPSESKYLLDVHQDFPFIQGSVNGVTVWMPFHDVELAMGVPAWIPGSHARGVQKVKEYSLEEAGGSGGRSFDMVDQDRFKGQSFTREPVVKGEALLFHTLLVHRSEPNVSAKARITIQLRFDDVTNKESFTRNYPDGLYLNERLAKGYPEYVVK